MQAQAPPQTATPGDAPDLLRLFLAGRDVECPNCAYNLRDLLGSRCPECGQEVAVRLQLAEPKLAAMLTGLIGVSAGAGLNGLLLVYFVIIVIVRNAGAGWNEFLVTNLVGFAVQATALTLWLWHWRRIRAANAAVRWTLAAGCWVLSLANIVVFSFTIR